MAERARAELIADAGRSAASAADFFRAPPFLAAEGVTHTLRIISAGREALVPLVVRTVPGADAADAISPYGYPGASVTGGGKAPVEGEVDWSATGIVSVFGRERLAGEPWLAAAPERSRVLVHDPAVPRRIRPRLAEQIRANARAGWAVEVCEGPAAPAGARDAFADVYAQTMTAVGAADRYFFAREYFDAVLSFAGSWLVSARRDGEVGAAAIAARSDGVLHYYLGGTADSARAEAPFKNVVAAMLDLADELGLPLNLGGGVVPGDGLERFKRGFANAELAFRTHEVVCDPGAYARLSDNRDAGSFFPAYRAG